MAQLPPPALLLGRREGGEHRPASQELRLAHPTISGQIHRLEEVLGEKLFTRRGRNLVLTEAGRVAFRYADEIFSLGREFIDTLKGRASGRPLRLVVGVADVLPPSLVRRFLEPAFRLEQPVQVICRADKSVAGVPRRAGAAQRRRRDRRRTRRVRHPGPRVQPPARRVRHDVLRRPKLAATLRRKFPRSLDGAPFLLPGAPSTVRRALEQWFDAQDIRPRIVAEFDDSALAKDFGEAGHGRLRGTHGHRGRGPAPIPGARGRALGGLRQQFYAISVERKIQHPAVVAICEAARQEIFAVRRVRPRRRRSGPGGGKTGAETPRPDSAAVASDRVP